jgi:mitogen-activated protein kinase kinase
MSIIELMHHIVREPAPRLPADYICKGGNGGEKVGNDAEEFVDACLEKEVEMRATPGVLLVRSCLKFDSSLC